MHFFLNKEQTLGKELMELKLLLRSLKSESTVYQVHQYESMNNQVNNMPLLKLKDQKHGKQAF